MIAINTDYLFNQETLGPNLGSPSPDENVEYGALIVSGHSTTEGVTAPEQMLTGGFCMREPAVVDTVATVHPSKPLGVFYLGLLVPMLWRLRCG